MEGEQFNAKIGMKKRTASLYFNDINSEFGRQISPDRFTPPEILFNAPAEQFVPKWPR